MKKHTAIITAGIALASLLVAGSATISAHHAFAAEFDARLGGRWARLRDASVDAEGVVADSVRAVFGLVREEMSDDEALDRVLNPARNKASHCSSHTSKATATIMKPSGCGQCV